MPKIDGFSKIIENIWLKKLNIALSTDSDEPKKVSMFGMITRDKLEKIMGSSEDLHAKIKNKIKK